MAADRDHLHTDQQSLAKVLIARAEALVPVSDARKTGSLPRM